MSISVGSSTSEAGSSTAVPTTAASAASQGVPTFQSHHSFSSTLGLEWIRSELQHAGCLDFFKNMTNTAPFRSCRPFSMLSLWSSSFTAARSNMSLLNGILWGMCNP
ncbi:hypothetical protein VKT23_011936 [Stygiomarasmius scandens]|uniref:DUF7729 domain-containing protein n=1 Tax=Marasmiellus scandens TaxID=2682957 RepID=A0ABR1JAR2_9AGAR